jgi:uncharacterized membrane protein
MRGAGRLLGPVLLLAGVALLAVSVATGASHLYLVLIFPVLTGSSALFGVGVLCVILGVLLLPLLAWAPEDGPERIPGTGPAPPSSPSRGGVSSGGVLLLGPVPIFFGTWRRPPGWAFWLAVGIGSAVLALALVGLYLAYRG